MVCKRAGNNDANRIECDPVGNDRIKLCGGRARLVDVDSITGVTQRRDAVGLKTYVVSENFVIAGYSGASVDLNSIAAVSRNDIPSARGVADEAIIRMRQNYAVRIANLIMPRTIGADFVSLNDRVIGSGKEQYTVGVARNDVTRDDG